MTFACTQCIITCSDRLLCQHCGSCFIVISWASASSTVDLVQLPTTASDLFFLVFLQTGERWSFLWPVYIKRSIVIPQEFHNFTEAICVTY